MAVRMSVRAVGLDKTRALLERMGRRAANLRPVLQGSLLDAVLGFFSDQFNTEGVAGGQPWEPLTSATLAHKGSRSGMGILQFQRAMWASFTKRGAPNAFQRATSDTLEVGSIDRKAIFHQEGFTVRNPFGRPARRAIRVDPRKIVPDEIPDRYTDQWDSLLLKHIEGV